jgi:hypothetical protein
MNARHGCNSLAGTHNAVNDPGLPAHFGDRPTGLNSNKSERDGQDEQV